MPVGLTMPILNSVDKTAFPDITYVGFGMSIDRLTLWQTYVRVIETGSFSAVARELGTTQPRVSKQIAALESQLGVRLIRRSTRKLSMTEEGERLYVLGVFGELDVSTDASAAAKDMRGVLSAAAHKDFTLRIFPRAGHSLAEMPSGNRMAPGVFGTLRSWLLARI
jgi:DNA-binding transcriptional LysR family regulator